MSQQSTSTSTSASANTTQPIKGDAHDPFLLFGMNISFKTIFDLSRVLDPNKEGQNVFNIIPQQDLYDPWGRPGGGAPLVHPPTGQKFTRYSGSLQDKLVNEFSSLSSISPNPQFFFVRRHPVH